MILSVRSREQRVLRGTSSSTRRGPASTNAVVSRDFYYHFTVMFHLLESTEWADIVLRDIIFDEAPVLVVLRLTCTRSTTASAYSISEVFGLRTVVLVLGIL
jgi:hypothetical protein